MTTHQDVQDRRAMSSRIIDGRTEAAELCRRVGRGSGEFAERAGRPAGLAVILVGDDPASQVYVRSKVRRTVETGMASFEYVLPAATPANELVELIDRLNADPAVDGILVQLPLPAHIDEAAILAAIDPAKDVDGFHVVNAGRLAVGQPALVPCTPAGCMRLIDREIGADLSGRTAIVVGRSNIVGKPMAQLLLAANATVTIAHSRTRNLPSLCRLADIVVAAVGRPRFIEGAWLKPGALVIDVGINRVAAPEVGDGRTRLVGDVDFDSCAGVAGAITPVPGGVGPMTIAYLLRNTLEAAFRRAGIELPPDI